MTSRLFLNESSYPTALFFVNGLVQNFVRIRNKK